MPGFVYETGAANQEKGESKGALGNYSWQHGTFIVSCVSPPRTVPDSHADIAKSMIGLLCMGKPDYEAIEGFREVPFFRHSLGIEQCPSSATLRQRLDVVGGDFDHIVKEEAAFLIHKTAPRLGTVSTQKGALVALDIDVSPFDNSKTKVTT